MKVWKRYELKDLRGIGLMNTERDRLNGGKSVINRCMVERWVKLGRVG